MKIAVAAAVVVAFCILPGDALAQTERNRFDSSGFMNRLTRELEQFDQAKTPDTAVNRRLRGSNAEQIKLPGMAAKISMYLAIIVAAIFGFAWLMRKGGVAGGSKLGGGNMDSLEVLPFGQNKSLVMARVVDAVYVLAQTPNAITVLEKIEGQRALDVIASSKGVVSITRFKDAFSHFLGKTKKS